MWADTAEAYLDREVTEMSGQEWRRRIRRRCVLELREAQATLSGAAGGAGR